MTLFYVYGSYDMVGIEFYGWKDEGYLNYILAISSIFSGNFISRESLTAGWN